jgi:hypothetical protein
MSPNTKSIFPTASFYFRDVSALRASERRFLKQFDQRKIVVAQKATDGSNKNAFRRQVGCASSIPARTMVG